MINEIRTKLMKAKAAYYNDESIMTDQEFDTLEEQLKSISPNDEYFTVVGAIANFEKITHEIPMLSMDKIKTEEEIIPWLSKENLQFSDIVVEPKIDGMSCTAKYENGKLKYLASRGDGKVGRNITHIAKHISIPKEIPGKNLEVRGELVLFKNNTVSNPMNKSLRNIVVGLVNRKEETEDLKQIHFIAYSIATKDNWVCELGDLYAITSMGFESIWEHDESVNTKVKTYDEFKQRYSHYLEKGRKNLPFETDGLVIIVNDHCKKEPIDSHHEISHHHFYNIALKPPAESKETTLRSIEWNTTRFGNVVPVAIFDPVDIENSTITRATLHNYANVLNHKLHIGDRIVIAKANEVIPYFVKNLTVHDNVGENIVPSKCPSCGEPANPSVSDVHIACVNPECPARNVAKVVHWVKNAEMDQISEKTIEKLFELKLISNIVDFYNLTPEKLSNIDGLGEKKIANIMDNIKKTKTMPISQFIKCLGISGLGYRNVKKMGIATLEQFESFDYRCSGYITEKNIKKFFNENRNFYNQLKEIITITDENCIINSDKVCMTGTGPKSRKELVSIIESMGYQFSDSVNKETKILVCEDPNGASSKLQKARKLGIQLKSYQEFFGEHL